MRQIRQYRPREEATVDLTPMLDIVFIMLIFFIVSSSFIQIQALSIEHPQASQTNMIEPDSYQVDIDANQQLWFKQQSLSLAQLGQELAQIQAPENSLVIHADKQVPTGKLVEVLDLAKSLGFSNISLATEKLTTETLTMEKQP